MYIKGCTVHPVCMFTSLKDEIQHFHLSHCYDSNVLQNGAKMKEKKIHHYPYTDCTVLLNAK